jgi:hypothetical protein
VLKVLGSCSGHFFSLRKSWHATFHTNNFYFVWKVASHDFQGVEKVIFSNNKILSVYRSEQITTPTYAFFSNYILKLFFSYKLNLWVVQFFQFFLNWVRCMIKIWWCENSQPPTLHKALAVMCGTEICATHFLKYNFFFYYGAKIVYLRIWNTIFFVFVLINFITNHVVALMLIVFQGFQFWWHIYLLSKVYYSIKQNVLRT